MAPLVDRSKAQVLQGELAGEARLRGSCIAPLAYAVEQQGASGRSPSEGVLFPLFASLLQPFPALEERNTDDA